MRNRLTDKEQFVLILLLFLLATGWLVKAYRASQADPQAVSSEIH